MNIQNEILIEERKILNEKWVTDICCAFGNNSEGTIFVSPSDNNIINRLWDLASVTKLYSLFAILSLCEEGSLDLRKRVDYYSTSFPGISHLCLYELLNFSVECCTEKRIDKCETYDKAVEALHSIKVKNYQTKYNDVNLMAVAQLINELLDSNSDHFFQNYISDMLKHIGAKRTFWWYEIPEDEINIESYDPEYKYVDGELIRITTPPRTCHDPKARILPLGHAGLFSCASDIALFASHILDESILSKKTLSILSDSTYDSWDSHHHFGLLCSKKHPDTLYSEVPASCGQFAVSMSGYTGCHLLLDFQNRLFVLLTANRIRDRITNLNREENKTYSFPCTKDWVFRKDDLVHLITQNLLP